MARLWSCVLSVALVAAALETAAGQNNLRGWWSFDGTFDDVSGNWRGPAVGDGGGDINLSGMSARPNWAPGPGYVHVGSPGYLQVPRVDFRTTSFTFSFSLRLNGVMGVRRFLYSDWSTNTWQFATLLIPDRRFRVWLRNSQENFVDLYSTAEVPFGKWVDIAAIWNRSARVASILIDQVAVGFYTVPRNLDVDLCESYGPYYQFGGKGDDLGHSDEDGWAPLDADVRNLRVFT